MEKLLAAATRVFPMRCRLYTFNSPEIRSYALLRIDPCQRIVLGFAERRTGLPWELYDLSKDWTQFENVADKYPAKLKELEKLFWTEAAKYQVLPLDASVATRLIIPKPSLTAGPPSSLGQAR
jgi:hypothetical protein